MSGFLLFPGASGEYASTPDSAAISVTDDFEIQAFIAPVDWTPGAEDHIAAKYIDGGNRTFRFTLTGSGKLKFYASSDGTASESVQLAAALGFTDGTGHWVAATFNGGVINFFKGGTDPDTPSWTQIEGDFTLATITSCLDATSPLTFGASSNGTSGPIAANYYHVRLYDDLTRTTAVFDADLTVLSVAEVVAGSFDEDSTSAATVTINGSAWLYSGLIAVTGTAVAGGVLESEIVTGGETIILTATGDEWVATAGDDNAITDAIIAGIDSAQAEAAGWDAEVKGNMVFGDVARTSDTVITITLAVEAAYAITSDETITVTVPATALTAAAEVVATPTFDVTAEGVAAVSQSLLLLGVG